MRLFAFVVTLIFLSNVNEFWKIGEQQGIFIHSDSIYFWLSDFRIFVIPGILLAERYTLFLGQTRTAKIIILAFCISFWLDCLQMMAGGNFTGWQWECLSIIACIGIACIVELKRKRRQRIGFRLKE